MKWLKEYAAECFTGIGLTLCALALGLVLFSAYAQEQEAASLETFSAWKKQNGGELNYEEWNRLRKHDLLPGQKKPDAVIYMIPPQ